MKKNIFPFALMSVFILFSFQAVYSQTALPEGDNGIAKNYTNDSGISGDSAVVFTDNFESYASSATLGNNWTALSQTSYLRIATEAGCVYTGAKSLEFTVPVMSTELSPSVGKTITPTTDILFLRHYAKFDPTFNITGSSHNGSGISSNYWTCGADSGPGKKANGTNKYLLTMECWRADTGTAAPGQLNIYCYHPLQRDVFGDHFFPTGEVSPFTYLPYDNGDGKGFGTNFISRPNYIPSMNVWHCYEVMLKPNTPTLTDGRIAGWVDGELKFDFMNLRLRDIPTLKIDLIGISLHAWANAVVTHKWVDNVVAATSYIGPIYTGAPSNGGGDTAQPEQRILTYPNPINFATATTVKLDSLTAGSNINIYNTSGNLVRTLVSGTNSGKTFYDGGITAYWDGTDESNGNVSDGVYFCVAVDSAGAKKRSKIAVIR